MRTGAKVAIGATIAAALIGGAVYVRRRQKGLGSADSAAKDRIGDLQDAIWDGVQNGQLRELAIALTSRGTRQITLGKRTFYVKGANCEPRDGRCEANTVAQWVADNPQLAQEAMKLNGDSSTALTCTLVSLNGVTCQLRAARQQDGSTRIYPTAGLPKLAPTTWAAVDSALPDYAFGRELPRTTYEDFDG
jgi:hypothetical protein